MNIPLPNARRLTLFLSLVVAALLLLSMSGQIAEHVYGFAQMRGVASLFNVNAESNLPTWYSSAAMFLAAGLLAIIAQSESLGGGAAARRWWMLTLVFLGLSIDEVAGIHELPIDSLRDEFGGSGANYVPWIVLGMASCAVLAMASWRLIWSLPSRTRWLFVTAAALHVGGAVGIETLSNVHASRHGEENLANVLIVTLEEACEMWGVVLFVYALREYIHRQIGAVYLVLEPQQGIT